MSKLTSMPKIWTKRVREAWQTPEPITVSQWADRNRILDPMTSAEPGKWRTDRTPYLRGIMDAFINPLVEKITLEMSTQVGKTESMLNMLGYAIDQDPGSVLFVYPRESDAKTASKTRIKPMIELAPALRSHCTKESDDLTKMQMRLDRMYIYFAGANSPAALSAKPVKYLFLDETDKYPKFSGEEADPIKLATERTRTFWDRKIIDCSTPTTKDGYIHREYERSDKRAYYVPCPHCGGYQVLEFDRVKVPETERDPDRIQLEQLAWYECLYCKGKITDLDKQNLLLNGIWLPAAIKVDSKGRIPEKIIFPETSHAGFHLNALYSPWLSFSDVIAEFFRSKDRIELLMNFINSWLAQIWQEKIEETKPDKLRKLCLENERGVVPDGAIVLVGGVDVQKNFFVCTIRAWGVYPESWLILDEIVEQWEDVLKIFIGTAEKPALYHSIIPGIEPFTVRLTCIDTGYRASEVYDICREFRNCFRAVKGKDQLTGVPYKTSNIDKYPDGRHLPGGLLLWLLDTTYFKDKISRMVHADQAINKWHLHRVPSEEYLKWFCGEHKVLKRDKKKGTAYEVWQPVSSHAVAHSWDAEVYAMAAAEMLRVFNLREEDKPKPIAVQQENTQEEKKNSWIPKKGKWLNHG